MYLSATVVLRAQRCASLDQHAHDSQLPLERAQAQGQLQRRLASTAWACIVGVNSINREGRLAVLLYESYYTCI